MKRSTNRFDSSFKEGFIVVMIVMALSTFGHKILKRIVAKVVITVVNGHSAPIAIEVVHRASAAVRATIQALFINHFAHELPKVFWWRNRPAEGAIIILMLVLWFAFLEPTLMNIRAWGASQASTPWSDCPTVNTNTEFVKSLGCPLYPWHNQPPLIEATPIIIQRMSIGNVVTGTATYYHRSLAWDGVCCLMADNLTPYDPQASGIVAAISWPLGSLLYVCGPSGRCLQAVVSDTGYLNERQTDWSEADFTVLVGSLEPGRVNVSIKEVQEP